MINQSQRAKGKGQKFIQHSTSSKLSAGLTPTPIVLWRRLASLVPLAGTKTFQASNGSSHRLSLAKQQHNWCRGFTYIEAIIAIGVIALLATVLVDPVRSYVNSQRVSSTAEQVNSLFSKARSHSLASLDNAVWGVRVLPEEVILFKDPYSPESPDNAVVEIPNGFIIEDIALSGAGNEVLFKRLSGSTDQSGSFDIIHQTDETIVRTITIAPSGVVGISQ